MIRSDEYTLAMEIASALNDADSFSLYYAYTRKYDENTLRRILNRVLSIPEDKIRKTRGALFTYLVNQHGKNK